MKDMIVLTLLAALIVITTRALCVIIRGGVISMGKPPKTESNHIVCLIIESLEKHPHDWKSSDPVKSVISGTTFFRHKKGVEVIYDHWKGNIGIGGLGVNLTSAEKKEIKEALKRWSETIRKGRLEKAKIDLKNTL